MILPILNQKAGPMPVTATFNSPSDAPTFLMVAGSVWCGTPNQLIGISVILDGKPIGVAQIFSNLASTHRAVVPTYIPVTLPEGKHTLTLQALNTHTVSDYNDFFEAVLFY